jgi:hypothetical protein
MAGRARRAADEAYPSLRDVPRWHDANVDPAHWAALRRDLIGAGRLRKNSPRAAPASATEARRNSSSKRRAGIWKKRASRTNPY